LKQRDQFLTALVHEEFHQGGNGGMVFEFGVLVGISSLAALLIKPVNSE